MFVSNVWHELVSSWTQTLVSFFVYQIAKLIVYLSILSMSEMCTNVPVYLNCPNVLAYQCLKSLHHLSTTQTILSLTNCVTQSRDFLPSPTTHSSRFLTRLRRWPSRTTRSLAGHGKGTTGPGARCHLQNVLSFFSRLCKVLVECLTGHLCLSKMTAPFFSPNTLVHTMCWISNFLCKSSNVYHSCRLVN